MKLNFLTILFCLISSITIAQDSTPPVKPANWISWGRVSFIFNQSAFNADWQGGGVTNVSGNLGISYDLQFKRKKLSWDTKLISDFGLSQVKDQRYIRKTTDRFELNSILGNQINQSFWNYSTIFNFRSQFISGYEFFTMEETGSDGLTRTVQKRRETSGSFSPSNFQLGLGFLWKKSNSFNFNIAPATTRLIKVSSNFTEVDINDAVALEAYVPFFGVEANRTTRWEVGASFRGYTKFEVAKNIQMENVLSLYSDYLADPENIDIDYNLNLFLKVNKYISGNFEFQAIYDDNTTKGFQIRQVIGLGFKYDLGERPKKTV